jgi:membrane associated rhomboid family serine protease
MQFASNINYTSIGKPLILSFGASCGIYSLAAYVSKLNEKRAPYEKIFRNLYSNEFINKYFGNKLSAGIIGINAGIFLTFFISKRLKNPKLFQSMCKYFIHTTTKHDNHYTLLTSAFAHNNSVHFSLNMFTFKSFSSQLIPFMGPELFLATYLTNCIGASCISHIFRNLTSRHVNFCGASGGIYGLVVCTVTTFNKSEVGIPFLPFTFNGQKFIGSVLVLESFLLIRKNSIIAHCAHLGGAFCGYLSTKFHKNTKAFFTRGKINL